MKNTRQVRNVECGPRSAGRSLPRCPTSAGPAGREASSARKRLARGGFTLIELLTVIAVMAILASFTLVVLHGVAVTKYRNTARAEMHEIAMALDAYKAQYGVYPPSNANLPGTYTTGLQTNSMFPQLYYELCGVTNKGTMYLGLDGMTTINNSGGSSDVQKAFGVAGFVNCTKGAGDDLVPARNFLLGLKANRIATVNDNGVWITNLVTSVRGPDSGYQPLGVRDANPFRYVYPGVNNPNSYDLWVELVISGKTNLICNWNSATVINSGVP